jgi:CRISPR-associated protein Cmr5
MSKLYTRQQRMAREVFKLVSTIELLEETKKKCYGSMAHRLPVLIHSAGLAQALAFVAARGKDEQRQLLDHLAQVVGQNDGKKLQKASYDSDLIEYMHLTEECLAALLWFKRYAQSVLNVDAATDVGDNNGTE